MGNKREPLWSLVDYAELIGTNRQTLTNYLRVNGLALEPTEYLGNINDKQFKDGGVSNKTKNRYRLKHLKEVFKGYETANPKLPANKR